MDILKYALENAIKYKGKADVNAVLGKIFNENKDIKDKQVMINKVREIVAEINALSLEEQLQKFRDLDYEVKEKKLGQRDLFKFLNIKGKVKTAFPPGPEKYPHIGHAKALLLNYLLAKQYKGKFILRFEDTNPELVKKEFYKIMLEDFKWLNVKWDKLQYASDYMKLFYKYCERLIKQGKVYICSCSKVKISEGRRKGIGCLCRERNKKENLELWRGMLRNRKGLIARLKIDMKHENSVMRDPTIFRVIEKKHARQGKKYRVWSNYDFQNAIMDGHFKITHRLRSKEFELRSELQRYIQKLLNLNETRTYEFARFNIEGVVSSGRVIREKIKKKELSGWDDPRLTTIIALRRRGFLSEAIKNFLIMTGISKSESTLTWDDLIIKNKRILDEKAKRFMVILNPKKIKIKNIKERKVKIPLHPEFDLGSRIIKTKDEFYIMDKLEKGKYYRFMHLFNFKDNKYVSDDLDKSLYAKLIHWLPVSEDNVKVEIKMEDSSIVKGLGENALKKVKVGEVIQLLRIGFVRLDKKDEDKLIFWFTHK